MHKKRLIKNYMSELLTVYNKKYSNTIIITTALTAAMKIHNSTVIYLKTTDRRQCSMLQTISITHYIHRYQRRSQTASWSLEKDTLTYGHCNRCFTQKPHSTQKHYKQQPSLTMT